MLLHTVLEVLAAQAESKEQEPPRVSADGAATVGKKKKKKKNMWYCRSKLKFLLQVESTVSSRIVVWDVRRDIMELPKNVAEDTETSRAHREILVYLH